MTKEIDRICNRTEVFQARLCASASQQIQRSQICCLSDCSFVRSWLAYSMQRQWPPWAEKHPEKSSIVTTSVELFASQTTCVSRALTYSLHLSCPAPAASKRDGKVVWQNVSSAKLVVRFKKKFGIFTQAYVSNTLIFSGLHTCCGSGRGCCRLTSGVLRNLSHSMKTPQKTCEKSNWKPGSFWCLAHPPQRGLLCSGGHVVISLLCWRL